MCVFGGQTSRPSACGVHLSSDVLAAASVEHWHIRIFREVGFLCLMSFLMSKAFVAVHTPWPHSLPTRFRVGPHFYASRRLSSTRTVSLSLSVHVVQLDYQIIPRAPVPLTLRATATPLAVSVLQRNSKLHHPGASGESARKLILILEGSSRRVL
ncbi:hypothetical protein BC826DRAFT_230574 [Russula brevipes]|nr:hypothetical protein BC826DRAFT_230574 [Russula brevipes]